MLPSHWIFVCGNVTGKSVATQDIITRLNIALYFSPLNWNECHSLMGLAMSLNAFCSQSDSFKELKSTTLHSNVKCGTFTNTFHSSFKALALASSWKLEMNWFAFLPQYNWENVSPWLMPLLQSDNTRILQTIHNLSTVRRLLKSHYRSVFKKVSAIFTILQESSTAFWNSYPAQSQRNRQIDRPWCNWQSVVTFSNTVY